MLRVGLTGGIGSGKTTAANYFQEFGAHIIDSDEIAKNLVQIDQPMYLAIIERYGDKILTADKQINRRQLRSIIFDDPNEKRWLEDLLHPLIKKTIIEEVNQSQSPYCIIVIPLLVETGAYDLINRILVVDSSIEKQVARTIKRDTADQSLIMNMIKNQATREERLAVATDIIYNNGSLEQLKEQVRSQHLIYLQLSSL